MTNEKGLYSRQNFVIKAISILSNIAGSVLKASDDNKWIFRSCKPDKSSLSTITLLSHVSAEFFKKKKNSLTNIVHADYCAFYGPNPAKQNQETPN